MVKGNENHSDSYPAGPIAVIIAEIMGDYNIKSTQGIEHILGEYKDAVYTVWIPFRGPPDGMISGLCLLTVMQNGKRQSESWRSGPSSVADRKSVV